MQCGGDLRMCVVGVMGSLYLQMFHSALSSMRGTLGWEQHQVFAVVIELGWSAACVLDVEHGGGWSIHRQLGVHQWGCGGLALSVVVVVVVDLLLVGGMGSACSDGS